MNEPRRSHDGDGAENQLEGRNPVLECLQRAKRRVHHIWLDEGAGDDPRLARILELAEQAGVPITRAPRRELDRRTEDRVHNGIVARVDPPRTWKTGDLLETLAGRDPFLIVADELSYEHNFGAILRSALGFGVDGVIVPTRRGAQLSPVVQRVAMGAVEEIPVVRESPYAALKLIRKAGIPIVGADMDGRPAHELDLRGPLALVVGGEGRGLPEGMRARCDALVSVPLAGQLESLNVSVAAAILMYEKRRQERGA